MISNLDSTNASFFTSAALEHTDEQLILQIADGNEAALRTLYSRHAGLVRTIAYRVMNNDHDVDDIVQDLFLEVWNQADRFRASKGTGVAWISTLARRRSIDRLRRKQAYLRATDRFRLTAEKDTVVFAPQSADENAVLTDRADALKKVLATLPPAQQQALELCYYSGLSQRQIAAKTGIPLGTIKTRLELAVRKVREAVNASGSPAEWAFMRA